MRRGTTENSHLFERKGEINLLHGGEETNKTGGNGGAEVLGNPNSFTRWARKT